MMDLHPKFQIQEEAKKMETRFYRETDLDLAGAAEVPFVVVGISAVVETVPTGVNVVVEAGAAGVSALVEEELKAIVGVELFATPTNWKNDKNLLNFKNSFVRQNNKICNVHGHLHE
jgi:hypothetical protein